MKKVKTLIISGIILLTICTIIYLLVLSNDIKQYAQSASVIETNRATGNSFIEVIGKLINSISSH